MRRIVFFFAILLFLFFATFGLSLLISPAWLKQPAWSSTLTVTIVIGGLILIGEGIISWALSFLFEDKEFNERLQFTFGNKYKEISRRLDEFTIQEINKEKKSKKYIPNIFVETTEIKEKLRYFSEPFTFFVKIVEQTDQELRGSYIVGALKHVHYPVGETIYSQVRLKAGNQEALKLNIQKYETYLNQKLTLTDILIKEKGAGIKPEYISKIPPEFSHIHDYMYPNLQHYRVYESSIEQAKENLNLLRNKLVIIKSKAGHGKTNLLCDFTEKFLLKRGHTCLYIPAKALNHLGEQETLEETIVRTIFTEPDIRFSDVIRLVKFDKKISHLFILIDGINEHKNLALFSTALEQFIERCSEHNIKIIVTCRSEYFDDRFGNLLLVDNSSVFDMDHWRYINRIPGVHVKALISGYFSEFNLKMSADNVHPEIMKVFNKDKLLLRIFCEAYENEQPADYLDNLYKLEIFKRYYDKKTETIHGLDDCLTEIIVKMIADNQFANIPIPDLSAETVAVVENTVYENVIIKKDMLANSDLAFGKSEVINFVYDEFRDFLLASKVIMEWDQDKQSSVNVI